MSIWDAFGKGRYKGFSREAGQLLDKAVELAGGLGCKRQTPATCCGRCCKRTAARRPAFWPGRTSRSWKCGVSCPPGGTVRSPGLPGAIWRRTCAGRWTTPSSGAERHLSRAEPEHLLCAMLEDTDCAAGSCWHPWVSSSPRRCGSAASFQGSSFCRSSRARRRRCRGGAGPATNTAAI